MGLVAREIDAWYLAVEGSFQMKVEAVEQLIPMYVSILNVECARYSWGMMMTLVSQLDVISCVSVW